MKALYGAEIEQGRSLLQYMSVPEDRALAGEQLVEESYSGEEFRSRHYFHISHSPIKTQQEEIIGVAVIAQDITARKLAEETLLRLNRELLAISNCNQTLMRATDEQALLNDICRIICDDVGYRMAWVGYAGDDAGNSARPMAWAGNEDDSLADADMSSADTEHRCEPTGTAMRSGESACIQDFSTESEAAPKCGNVLLQDCRSGIALPLKNERSQTFGVLTIYSTETDAFTTDEIRLLEELAGNLAFGIRVLRTRTERRQMEHALTVREQQYRSLVENIPDFIVRYDVDLRRIFVNPAWEKASGLSLAEVIDKPPSETPRVPRAIAPEYVDSLRKALETGTRQTLEFSWVNAFGTEAKYKLLLRNIRAVVIVHGTDTRILMSNPTARELLGLSEEQMLGKAAIDPAWHFLREDGSSMPSEEYPVNRVLAGRQPVRDPIAGVQRPDRGFADLGPGERRAGADRSG